MGCDDRQLSVLLCDDEEIAQLNAQYRNKPEPTDVLSFSQSEDSDLLGDVVISVETAQRQAAAAGVSEAEEIVQLLIHGLLHLLGYEHENVPEQKVQEMRDKESLLFESVREDLTES